MNASRTMLSAEAKNVLDSKIRQWKQTARQFRQQLVAKKNSEERYIA